MEQLFHLGDFGHARRVDVVDINFYTIPEARRSNMRHHPVGLGFTPVFAETENPFPCMSEAMDLKKEKDFFETRVIECQNGGALSWE
jgi:hypothetical protein